MLAVLDSFVCFYRGKCADTNPADDLDGDVETSPTSANPKYECEQSEQGLRGSTLTSKPRVHGRQKNSSPVQCAMPDSWPSSTKSKTLTPSSLSPGSQSAHAWPLPRVSSGLCSPPLSLWRSASQSSFHSVLSQCSTDCGGEANNFYRLLDADPEMLMLT
jgi:hypothetical protein